ncbi:SGNH/GDSL hydrolase family protein [Nitratireductor mangrovi]|uniref:SGNH/GDSL hydrolase family protein n=1 Tax=Nitratireductor mangrovi TaxID=2599600 RepID=A0A5B8L4E9_9HYPH|nr:SGNH/GDSL hydrolase family protein [Nitratireductor mangrovi]QDZ02438.1 SGNH/GDSL hydrolase family protein [Nitratireductor mangrovi]
MKTILCYGDSLTWGYNPEGPSRHAPADRWPDFLQAALGERVRVIAEGLNGRTTAFDDHLGSADRNGARILPTLLTTHAPLDLIIIMLGANDMKPFVCGQAIGAKQGMERLVAIVRGHSYPLDEAAPEVLVVAPPPLCETADPDFAAMFAGGLAQSRMLASFYADLADVNGCGFFDAGSVAETSPADGVHLDAENTRAIGRGLEPVVRMMLGL